MPAWNIFPTEMLTQEPAMTMGTLGGMIGPTTDEAAVTATEKSSSYPSSTMAGISMLPRLHTSAMAVPDMPANTMLATIFTSARLPRKCPRKELQKLRIRLVMPPPFISAPASMNPGMQSRVKESIPE